jgi:hypothetical protein
MYRGTGYSDCIFLKILLTPTSHTLQTTVVLELTPPVCVYTCTHLLHCLTTQQLLTQCIQYDERDHSVRCQFNCGRRVAFPQSKHSFFLNQLRRTIHCPSVLSLFGILHVRLYHIRRTR